jgi:hypothetical protein
MYSTRQNPTRAMSTDSPEILSPETAEMKPGDIPCVLVEVLSEDHQKHVEKMSSTLKKQCGTHLLIDIRNVLNKTPDEIKKVKIDRFLTKKSI